jgi:hypothetical protein
VCQTQGHKDLLVIIVGSNTKVFSIVDVSEAAPTRHELAQWLREMSLSGSCLNEMQVQEKRDILNAIRSFSGPRPVPQRQINHSAFFHKATTLDKQHDDYVPSVLSHSISLPISGNSSSTFDASHFGDIYTSSW